MASDDKGITTTPQITIEEPVTVTWQRAAGERLGVVMMSKRRRVLIDLVHKRGVAHHLGLQPGMQLLAINGKHVTTSRQAMDLLATFPVGKIELTYKIPPPRLKQANTYTTVRRPSCATVSGARQEPVPTRFEPTRGASLLVCGSDSRRPRRSVS